MRARVSNLIARWSPVLFTAAATFIGVKWHGHS
jgi:hypothetical protein